MNRWKAAGLHLIISVVVAAAAVALMLGVMYPLEFFRVSGGFKLLTIMLSVDVIIGPLLTLIVFKPNKPSLKFDLTCIALVQLAALLYGGWVVVQARPVFLVHVGDRFHLVRASDIDEEVLSLGQEERFRTLSWTGPRLAVAASPKDLDRRQELMMSAISGFDLQYYPETYLDYAQNSETVLLTSQYTSELLSRRPEDTSEIKRFLETTNRSTDDVVVIPLKVGLEFMTALVDAESAEILEFFQLDPWD